MMNKTRNILAIAAVTGAVAMALAPFAAAQETIADGVYTAEQAERGKALYEENCQSCHNIDFYEQSLSNRVNQPVLYMFEEVLGTMPLNAPGFLPIDTYEDIFAYIFSEMGFPAGETELDYDSGMMGDVMMVQPE